MDSKLSRLKFSVISFNQNIEQVPLYNILINGRTSYFIL